MPVQKQLDLVFLVMDSLCNFSSPFIIDSSVEHKILIAFKSQQLLGWESLLYGFISTKIIEIQQQYYTEIERRKLETR